MTETAIRRIVLFDDDGDRIKSWEAKLKAVPGLTDRFDISAREPDEFAEVFEALKSRQIDTRGSGPESTDAADILDQADIVIVDFDLTPARGQASEIPSETLRSLRGSFGDTFAYLTRCYTTAGYTVLVNQTFYQPTFDLTMRQFESSYADLNVSDQDLGNELLWTGETRRGQFRPWHWPRLMDCGQFIRQLADKIDLKARILETLGLDEPDIFDEFDPQQLETLGAEKPREATFNSIISPTSPFGLLSAKEELGEEARKKISAIALTHWLERVVIPGQNVLVDAPHLAQRRPHLVRGDQTVDSFNKLADQSRTESIADLIDVDALKGARTPASDWTMRPVWLWPRSPRGPVTELDLVFCEDTSCFRPIDDAHEFNSELPGPFRTRFVEEVDDQTSFPVEYRPDGRFYQ